MDEEKISYKTLIDGDIPPWVMRFIKGVGKTPKKIVMLLDAQKMLNDEDIKILDFDGEDPELLAAEQ